MAKIFVSYRREDTEAITHRICEHLDTNFGKRNVFIDAGGIPPGSNFPDHILKTLAECDFLLAVVGPNWLKPGVDGHARLFDEADWVRLEIDTALKKKLPVIPLLIGDVTMPSDKQLPDVLHEFASLQWLKIDPGLDFQNHIWRLIDFLGADRHPPGPRLELTLAEPKGGSIILPKIVQVPAGLVERLDAESTRMGLQSSDWAKKIVEAERDEPPSSPLHEYAFELHCWYIDFLKATLRRHTAEFEAARTVIVRLDLANVGTQVAEKIEVELQISPQSKVNLASSSFYGSHSCGPAPAPPPEFGLTAPKETIARYAVWYSPPDYGDGPQENEQLRLSDAGKNKNGSKLLKGKSSRLHHDKTIPLAPIHVFFGEGSPEDIDIQYKLFAENQPKAGTGYLKVKVSG